MEKLYKIEQPNIDKFDLEKLIPILFDSDLKIYEVIKKTETPEYLHWKEIKYKTWIPEQFKNEKEKFWALVKFHRKTCGRKTVICDSSEKFFTWEKLSYYEEIFHGVDLDMSKYLLNFPDSVTDRQKYQMKGIMEEAIASSQLEGAHTTRKVAKQMIQEKRAPKTHAEKMIFNNFIAMKAIQEKYKNEKLSLDVLFDLHRTLTVGTMDEEEQGRFRLPTDKIVIQKGDSPKLISYVAPPIGFVEKEIKRFIDFANDDLKEEYFIHPIIKAIMLHFWMGLLHPFVDGNGRLARGMFYWYLLRKGYWAFSFLPISLAIKSAPAQYGNAYVLSEQDDNNLTYFIDYHIRKINQAIENFKVYIKQKSLEGQKIDKILQSHKNLNRRQIDVLMNFRQDPEKLLNVSSYINIYEVTKATAINDLKGLVAKGFLKGKKHGRNVFYSPTKKAQEIL